MLTSSRILPTASRRVAELGAATVQIVDDPPGTQGYGDLERTADSVALDDGHAITVAGLADLLRIALSDRDEPSAMSAAIGLDAALRAHRPASPTSTPPEADEAIERWLSHQTPLAR